MKYYFSLPFYLLTQVANIAQGQSMVTAGRPSDHEMHAGIRQALEQALTKTVGQISVQDGFFGNDAIKLLFPPEARKVERTLRGLGLNSLCDRVILQMNRAAEDASRKALPIFVRAAKEISVKDAVGILTGASGAATQYFKEHTEAALRDAFKPVIDSSLSKLNATSLYRQAVTKYNALPLVNGHVDADLGNYANTKAIDGLFTVLATKESALRSEIADNPSALVKKVFSFFKK